MATKTLFLAWQDSTGTRLWFPVGRLDADVDRSDYRFRYTGGMLRAQTEAGFTPILSFPDLYKDYRSSKLFALFSNRVMWPSRPDFPAYLQSMDLPEDADPMDMLAVSGGSRITDSYEVFPKLVRYPNGSFTCRFFLHGGRRVNGPAQEKINSLKPGDELYGAVEVTNPLGELALQIQTTDYHMIGWAPRYLAPDLVKVEAPRSLTLKVVGVNPMPSPSEQRVLIEIIGNLGQREPMAGPDFQPLVD
jgi:hypothetical protein